MATSLWAAWFDDVLPNVPGCGQALARHHIRAAAIEFCERSEAWRIDLDPLDAFANDGLIEFDTDAGIVVVRALAVWFKEKPLSRKGLDELREIYQHWPSQVGEPQFYTQENPSDSLILVPKSADFVTSAVTGKLAVKPSRTATGIDSIIFERWSECIANGALARLFAMKKKPWSDANLSVYHKGLFDKQVATAKLAAEKGFTKAPKRVRAQFL